GVGHGGAGHGDGAADVLHLVEFGLEVGFRGTADAIAIGGTGLGHEALDDAVPLFAVVVTLARQLFNTGDVGGGDIREHLDDNATVLEVEEQGIFGRGGVGGGGHQQG